MTLYEIDAKMRELIDPETGELKNYDDFAALDMERSAKIENTGEYIKNLKAEATAIKAEIDALNARYKAAANRAASLTDYLAAFLSGERFTSPRLAISYRKSTALEFEDEWRFVDEARKRGDDWALRYKPPEIDKTAVKQRLAAGWQPADELGVKLVERQNIQIK